MKKIGTILLVLFIFIAIEGRDVEKANLELHKKSIKKFFLISEKSKGIKNLFIEL